MIINITETLCSLLYNESENVHIVKKLYSYDIIHMILHPVPKGKLYEKNVSSLAYKLASRNNHEPLEKTFASFVSNDRAH